MKKEDINSLAAEFSNGVDHKEFLTRTGINTDLAVIKGFIAGYNASQAKPVTDIVEISDNESTIKSVTSCPTCGSECEVGSGDSGSHYYIPKSKPQEIELNEVKDLLCEVNQLISGWNATEKEWSEWDKQVVEKISVIQSKLDHGLISTPITSDELIGNVKQRFNEIFRPDRRWDAWRSFYNGWIEGRTDLIRRIKLVDTKTVDAVNIPELVNEFMDGFEDPFIRGEMYKSETSAHSINIAYYFELAMEYALLHKQDIESKK